MEQPGAEKTILVVDDEEAVVEFVTALLEDMGFRVLRAYEGRSALEIAQAQHPDLILSDIMMPIMDGIELYHRLRQDPQTADIPVILMTAGRTPALRNNVRLLAKPFDLEDLVTAIHCLLRAA